VAGQGDSRTIGAGMPENPVAAGSPDAGTITAGMPPAGGAPAGAPAAGAAGGGAPAGGEFIPKARFDEVLGERKRFQEEAENNRIEAARLREEMETIKAGKPPKQGEDLPPSGNPELDAYMAQRDARVKADLQQDMERHSTRDWLESRPEVQADPQFAPRMAEVMRMVERRYNLDPVKQIRTIAELAYDVYKQASGKGNNGGAGAPAGGQPPAGGPPKNPNPDSLMPLTGGAPSSGAWTRDRINQVIEAGPAEYAKHRDSILQAYREGKVS